MEEVNKLISRLCGYPSKTELTNVSGYYSWLYRIDVVNYA